jgi:hypothetical protein
MKKMRLVEDNLPSGERCALLCAPPATSVCLSMHPASNARPPP